MARRRQTTGMPRRDKGQSDVPENPSFFDNLLGKPKNRAERDEAINRLIQRSVGAVAGVLAIIVAAFLIYEFLVVPQLNVATVNGERITVGEFRERVAFERGFLIQQYNIRINQLQQQAAAFGMDVNQLAQQDQQLQTWSREIQFPDALGDRVLDEMIDDLLIRQEFNTLGLTVDDSQVTYSRQDFFGFDPTQNALIGTPATETPIPTSTTAPLVSPTPSVTPFPTSTPTLTPSPTVNVEATAESTLEATAEVTSEVTEVPTLPPSPTPSQEERLEDFNESADLFETSLRESDVSQSAIDSFWQREAIRDAVAESIAGELTITTYVNARHILVETEEEATQIVNALNAGESFSLLASANSLDTSSGQRGGELGWQAADLYVGPFADAVRTGELGVTLPPVQTDFGWHIIQVREREERPIETAELDQIREARLNAWLETRREEVEAAGGIETNENWPDFLVQ